MSSIKKKSLSYCCGFTLVEMSFVLLISGIIVASLVAVAKQMNAVEKKELSERVMDNSQELLDNFYATMRRYPCPADPTLNPGDALFGVENCLNPAMVATATGANAPVLFGDFPQRISVSPGGGPPYYAISSLGRIGAQFDGKQEFRSRDSVKSGYTSAWGEQMTYAVTQSLTSLTTFDQDDGAVIINDDFGNPIEMNAHYTIVSHGENSQIPCDPAIVITLGSDSPDFPAGQAQPSEEENCDGDDQFVAGILTGANGRQHYDDEIRYTRFADLNYWEGDSTNVGAVNLAGVGADAATSTRVGIGVTDPDERLEVNGEIRVDSFARSRRICNRSGDVCLNLDNLKNITCTEPGEYLKGINLTSAGAVEPNCQPITEIGEGIPDCPPGTYLQGFLTTGGPSGRICNQPPPPS